MVNEQKYSRNINHKELWKLRWGFMNAVKNGDVKQKFSLTSNIASFVAIINLLLVPQLVQLAKVFVVEMHCFCYMSDQPQHSSCSWNLLHLLIGWGSRQLEGAGATLSAVQENLKKQAFTYLTVMQSSLHRTASAINVPFEQNMLLSTRYQ